jgi:hypothetical protein
MAIASVSVPVPSSGDGAPVSIANLVGEKTVILTGLFKGQYAILAGHELGALVPVLQFDAGGEAGLEQTLPEAYSYVAVRAQVNNTVIGPPITVVVNGVVGTGENKFAPLASLVPGSMGPQAAIDTYALFPPTGLEESISIICSGLFEGNLIIEGSEDQAVWNPIGQFAATPVGRTLLGLPRVLEFGPLGTPNLVRYVRVNVSAKITGPTTLTIGGRIPAAGGAGGTTTLEFSSSLGKETTPAATDEEILYQEPVDLTTITAATIKATLSGIVCVTGPTNGTFKAYLGSVTPGVVGTLAATITTNSNGVQVLVSATGAAIATPGGVTLLQITGRNDAGGTSKIFSFNLSLS